MQAQLPSKLANPVFIGGLMKSGTSLLRKLLSLHPSLFSGLETFWFDDEFVNEWRNEQSKRQTWLTEFYELNAEECTNLRSISRDSYEFLDHVLSYCARRSGKNRWVEKTPDNVLHIPLIQTQWNDATILIMNRDLRDVYASWKRNEKRSLEYFLEIAEKFLNTLSEVRDDSRVLVIQYEELVSFPEKTLRYVLAFIDEPYVAGLEKYKGDDTDYKKVLEVTGKVSTTTESLAKPIFKSSVGQWSDILSKRELQAITHLYKRHHDG